MVFFSLLPPPPRSTLFPYTTLFRSDYEILELREDAGFAGGVFTVKNSAPNEAELFRADSLTLQGRTDSASAKLLLLKQYTFSPAPNGFEAACVITLKFKETLEKPVAVGIDRKSVV